jgi:uncharacterized repeat protein (TIGR03803 family)
MSLFQNAHVRMSALAALAFTLCAPITVHAQTPTYDVENTLVTFDGTNGRLPDAGLILANDGNYYGVTYDGGANGFGEIYRLIPNGKPITSFTQEILYSFGTTGGQNPMGGLIQGTDGNLYGTTYSDAVNSSGTTQTLTTLHTFTGSSVTPSDLKHPEASLIEGTDGYLYGTGHGGSGVELITNGGIFKISKSGTGYTVLHSCTTGTTLDCNSPVSPLVQASNGNFYGMSYTGGANGLGDVYKITSTGTYTELASFSSALTSPATPYGNLEVGPDGTTLFGVTYAGGANNDGSFFSFVDNGSSGTPTLLYSFAGKSNAGKPQAGLILGSDGNFYGTSEAAGGNSDGTVWMSSPTGVEAMIYPFEYALESTDGATPVANPIQGADGQFYGTASVGGTSNYGTVWQVIPATTLANPITISLSPTTIALGSSTTLSYSSPVAYGATMSQCFATSSDSEWSGVKTIKPTATTLSLKPANAGTYVYTITCGGTQSASATLTVTGSNKTNTTTAISVSPTSTTVGNTVTFSATVKGTSGTPTGSVSFYFNGILLHTSTLSNGTGLYPIATTGLPAGTYGLSASYSGDGNNNASSTTSNANVTLTNNTTATVLTITPNPPAVGGTVTMEAVVSRTNQGATGIPGGTVNFYVGTGLLNSTPAKVNAQGQATFSIGTTGVPTGSYPIHAVYSGENGDNASTSNTVTLNIN